MRLAELKGKKVGIWGSGREGSAVLEALRRIGADGFASMFQDGDTELLDRVLACEVIVKSPGVSLYRPEIREALRRGIRVTSATNLALSEIQLEKVIAVTGTKGKSTTSSLLAHLLRASGRRVVLAGNIGVPILQSLRSDISSDVDHYVVELSSYQIADLCYFPAVGVLTNLYQDHVTWHETSAQYRRDKFRLFSSREQTAILNLADPQTREHASGFSGKIQWYNSDEGFRASDGQFMCGTRNLFPVEQLRLPGAHNISNACAAFSVLDLLGIDVAALGDAVSGFSALPHRLAVLGERNGRTYVDDSISTVPETALAALRCFPGRPVSLILGGLDRGQDWAAFARNLPEVSPKVVLTLPDNGSDIARTLRDARIAIEILECKNLEDAVLRAEECTPEGGVVLLSPASASFTHFANFEERGRAFAKLAGFPPSGG